MGLFGGSKSSTVNEYDINNSVNTTNRTTTSGAQSGDYGVSASNSTVNVTDGGAVRLAGDVMMKTIQANIDQGREAFGFGSGVVDRVIGSLAGSAELAQKQAGQAIGQAFSMATAAKAPDSVASKNQMMLMGVGFVVAVVGLVMLGRSKAK